MTNYEVRNNRNSVGYESIMVPGFLKGIDEAWRRFRSGHLSWSSLLSAGHRVGAGRV